MSADETSWRHDGHNRSVCFAGDDDLAVFRWDARRSTESAQKLLFTCFRRPKVPPTNNLAERSLRPVVIMRRIIQGTRSEKGLENHSVLRSLFETAKRQGKKGAALLSRPLYKRCPSSPGGALQKSPGPKAAVIERLQARQAPVTTS